MTCIAWDGKTLAADKLASYNGMVTVVKKIHRVNGLLVGCSGDLVFGLEMIEWVRGGRKPEEFPQAQRSKDDWQPVLVIEEDGTASLYERSPCPIKYEQTHIAIGCGREFAMAALHLGCDAAEAVAVANALSHNCGQGIDILLLHSAP